MTDTFLLLYVRIYVGLNFTADSEGIIEKPIHLFQTIFLLSFKNTKPVSILLLTRGHLCTLSNQPVLPTASLARLSLLSRISHLRPQINVSVILYLSHASVSCQCHHAHSPLP